MGKNRGDARPNDRWRNHCQQGATTTNAEATLIIYTIVKTPVGDKCHNVDNNRLFIDKKHQSIDKGATTTNAEATLIIYTIVKTPVGDNRHQCN